MFRELAIAGGAAGLAAGSYAYAAMWPTSQLFGKVIVAGADPGQVALTFDDGPNDPWTYRLLEILDRYQVRATFFFIGRFVRQRPRLVRAVAESGHLIGNHTMTHPMLLFASAAKAEYELAACNRVLEDVTGSPVRYFRPPHGARRPAVLSAARRLGMTPVLWNVMGHDWDAPSAEAINSRLEREIARNQRQERSSNILLHDGGQAGMGQNRGFTVEAAGRFLARHAGSLRFVTPESWG